MQGNSIRKQLNIPQYKMTRIISENDNEIHIRLEPYRRKAFVCSGCGEVHRIGYHGIEESVVEDLALFEKRVYLHGIKRRYRCLQDNRIHIQEVPWLKKWGRVTKRFAERVNRITAIPPEADLPTAEDEAKHYISSTNRYAVNALIVYDRFHITQKLNWAVDMVRKEELRKARADENNELIELINCRQRFILLKNPAFGGTEKQANYLQRLCEINQPIYKAMLLKESFLQLYSYSDIEEAKAYLANWIREALASSLQAFKSLAQSFTQKMQYIINWFKKKISSAISEGFNNKNKRLKRMAYGYKDIEYFRLNIHQHCGLLNPRKFPH